MTVKLSHNLTVQVDREDLAVVRSRQWRRFVSASGMVYAAAEVRGARVYLHRVILGLTRRRVLVKFKNGNGLDCRRSNLALQDHRMLSLSRVRRPGRTGYRGVGLTHRGTLRLRIRIGTLRVDRAYRDAVEAARAYDRYVSEYSGGGAVTNRSLGLIA